MKTNAKRFLALFLALTMVCSMLPMTALAAAEADVTVGVSTDTVTMSGLYDRLNTGFGSDANGVPIVFTYAYDYRFTPDNGTTWYTFNDSVSLPADGTTVYQLYRTEKNAEANWAPVGTFVIMKVDPQVVLNEPDGYGLDTTGPDKTATVPIYYAVLAKGDASTSKVNIADTVINYAESECNSASDVTVKFYADSGNGFYDMTSIIAGKSQFEEKGYGDKDTFQIVYGGTWGFGGYTTENFIVVLVEHEYDVTYTDGLSGALFVDQTYTKADGGKTPAFTGSLSRDGYRFVGWDSNGDSTADGISATVTANVTYTALWEELHTVTFMNGTTELESYEQVAGKTAYYSGATPTKAEGDGNTYAFIGWNTDKDATEAVALGAITGDVTYYAIFKAVPKSFTITWNYDDTAKVDTYAYGDTIIPFYPTKTGSNWTWNEKIPATMPAENLEFTGYWTDGEYTITWIIDGVPYDTDTYAYGAAITVPTPTKEGYTFSGWGEVPATMPAENLTFSGSYSVNSYTISWDTDGDGTVDISKEVAYGAEIEIPDDPEKSGHAFAGWDSDDEGNEADIVPSTMPAKDLSYTALFEAGKYTVNWIVDGKTAKTETYAFGDTITAPADPSKEGYTFKGWDGFTAGMTMPAETKNFTAVFEVNSYTLTWVVDGETVESKTVEYGAAIAAPADPEKEGHTFANWGAEVPATMPAENLTFTAVWDVNEYTLTWVVDGETVESKTVEYGAAITAPADPEKEGHTFANWGAEVPATMPAENLTFTAVWDVNEYTITWDTGIAATTEKADYEYGAAIAVAADPEKDGYIFKGWDTDGDGEADGNFPATMPAKDLTFTAVWQIMSISATNGNMTSDDISEAADTAALVEKIQEVTGMSTVPESIKADVNTLYRARVEGATVKLYLPAEYAQYEAVFARYGISFPYELTLNEVWLEVGESIPEVNTETAVKNVISDVIAGFALGNMPSVESVKAALLEELKYYSCNAFGANPTAALEYTESVKYTYEDGEALIISDVVIITVKESRIDTEISAKDSITVVYGECTTEEDFLEALEAKILAEGAEIEGTITFDREVVGLAASDTAYEVTLSYAGENKYLPSGRTVYITVNKALAEIDIASQAVKYTGTPVSNLIVANCETINFIVGIDGHDETYVVGMAQVAVPEALYVALDAYYDFDLNDLTIDQVKQILSDAEMLGNAQVSSAVSKIAQYKDEIEQLVGALQKVQAELNQYTTTELRISLSDALTIPTNVGMYVVGSIVSDSNYAAPSQEESMAAGYLVIVPDGVQAQLAWYENDDNYIVTLEKLKNADLSASVTDVVGTPDNGNTISGQPADHLEYLFVGVDNDGELILNRVRTTEDVNEVLTEVGVYAQVAYIANWDNVMYYAMPIARPVIVSPNVADVKILDANGNENYAQVYTYTGEPIDVTVTVDGLENVEGLSFKFIGSDTTVDGWYRSEAPTDAGVYTLIAVYTETDADGDLCKAGGAVGIIIIEPADAEVGLEYTEVCPNGEEHFATITNEALDYITIAIDRDANTAYVNLPADVKAHAERIVGYLPAEIEAKVMALLEKYSEFDGDVSSATVKAELESIMAELIEYNMTEKAYELAKETVAKIKDEIANNEDIQALASRIKEEVATIESKITEKLSKEYAEQIVNYLKEIYESGDVDVDALKTKLENKIKAMVEENPELEAIAGVLYLMSEDIVAAIKNSDEVDQVIAEIENIIAKVKSLGLDDAEAIATKLVGYMAEQVDTEQLKALLEEAVAKVENLGYIEYAKQLLSDMSAMYPIDVDVDAYVNAVKTELEALVNTVKAKIKSGELKETDLDDIEAYVDSILGQLNTLIDKIPEGYTVVFGSNPTEEGTYDCYAMNISANYKPEFVSATLVIGHVAVIDAAVAPTCTETGLTEGSHCAKCGVTLVAQETVPATDHDWELTGTVPSSCTEKGVQKYTCKNDPTHTKEVAIEDLAAHTPETDAAVPATCITTGLTEGSHCSVCDAVIVAQETVPATGHDWGAWVVTTQPTYTSEGVMTRVCANDESHVETRTIAKLVYVAPVIPQPTVNVRGLNTVDHVSYIIGYTDGTVKPTGTITRAEMATIFFRLMTEDFRDKYWSTSNRFADVDADKWYNLAISTLDAAGVITDSDDGLFRPNEPITRAELAVLAAQFCTVTGNIPYASFTDVPMNHWAAKEIALVEYAGWIEGYKGKFRPEDNLTRGEAVTIVNRMLNRGAEAEDMLDNMVTFTDNVYGAWYYEAIQEAANSHLYVRSGKLLEGEKFVGEKWTYLLENPDWAAIEKGWVAAHAE